MQFAKVKHICSRSGSWMILSLKYQINQDQQPEISKGQASNWIFERLESKQVKGTILR